jgi:hypothetical protein
LVKLRTILSVSRGGIVVALNDAHPGAARPLVELLLDGHAPGDTDAPCVSICFHPRELLDVPHGARVVLLGADQDPAWLNFHRPIVREHGLAVLLWATPPVVLRLRTEAPDFLDWVSHRIDVPAFASPRELAALRGALARWRWVAVEGRGPWGAAFDGPVRELDVGVGHDELAPAMETGDVVVYGLEGDDSLWQLMFAHAQLQWRHRVVLVEPAVLPPVVELLTRGDWEASARQLGVQGVPQARVVAALRDLEVPMPLPAARRIRMLQPRRWLLRYSTLNRVARREDPLDDWHALQFALEEPDLWWLPSELRARITMGLNAIQGVTHIDETGNMTPVRDAFPELFDRGSKGKVPR